MCCIALRHNMARNSLHAQGRVDRSHGPLPLRRFLVLAVLVSGAVLLSAPVVVAAAKKGPKAFRCESEEDLDGSACRVDMLPDAALAEMIYERSDAPKRNCAVWSDAFCISRSGLRWSWWHK